MANGTIFVITKNSELKIRTDDSMEIIHIILILTVGSISRAVVTKRRQPGQDF
jgi:hypothetical protein